MIPADSRRAWADYEKANRRANEAYDPERVSSVAAQPSRYCACGRRTTAREKCAKCQGRKDR